MEIEPRYWRIRMTFGPGGQDVSKLAWEQDKIGIWYGAWNAEELEEALTRPTTVEQRERLSQSAAQSRLWGTIPPRDFATILRFRNIQNSDWVYVYFEEALHFAKVIGPIRTETSEKLNLKNPSFSNSSPEIFKYRQITEKKSFQLGKLPTSFLILRSAGRNNVYEHSSSYWHLVKMLAESRDEGEVEKRFRSLSLEDWLTWTGDKTWEAICEGYLILERNFLPTDLNVGGTLPVLDIVGFTREGTRILAQCKKGTSSVGMDNGFLSLCNDFPEPKELFYFAFGGVTNPVGKIQIIDKDFILHWLQSTPNGRLFRKLLGLA